MKRRDFLLQGATLAAGLTLGVPGRMVADDVPARAHPATDPGFRDLAMRALDAARSAGADYADFRINRTRTQNISTRDRRVSGFTDSETFGFGVRVLVAGTWGFAASREVEREEVVRVARRAVAQARANQVAQRRRVELAPVDSYPDGVWRSPIEIDPFTVPVAEKVELLLAANTAALAVAGARFVTSSMAFVGEEKFFASSEGTVTEQTIYRCWPRMSVTAVAADGSDFQSRDSTPVQPLGLGYEHVRDARLVENAPVWAEEAVEKLTAKPVQPGSYDLVLLPSHLFLTIHESIAHPTELDRIMGFEANYAGTSFISPDFLGNFRYGPEIMNIQGERSAHGGMSTCGWDDEGVRPVDYLIVEDGILRDLQTTREQAPWLEDWYREIGQPVRSHGQSYAQTWADMQFQRMPNINLLPHPERNVPLEELIDGVDNGIMIEGRGSYSIDQQRYNSQYGGQVYWEIRNGRVTGMLKDVAYQIRTPEFWNAMDLIGGESTYELGGTFGDAKGQPAQSNAVSHGCVPTRHRGVTVINTGRQG
jgi:TldD protein